SLCRLAGALQAASEKSVTLVLAEATPYPERLTRCERALAAHVQDGAAGTELLGGFCPAAPCGSALALRVEEQFRVCLSAGPFVLPLPLVLGRCRQFGHRVHKAPFSGQVVRAPLPWTTL